MASESEDQERIWKSEEILAYHARQFSEPYRSTVHLGQFMRSLGLPSGGDALDVGCGAGAPIHHLAPLFPGFRWTGIDYAGSILFPLGRPLLEKRGIEVELIEGDFLKLTQFLPRRGFDLVLSMQTLSCVPYFRAALDQLLAMTKQWLVISSLFTEFDIDARIEVIDHSRRDGVTEPQYYCVYSLSAFREYCEGRGFSLVASREFAIDIDLPRQSKGRGTYTRTLAEGRRLQFSGPLCLPWWFIALKRNST